MKRMNFPNRKKLRQEDAKVRQEKYDKLSIEEKKQRILAATKPGSYTRERALAKIGFDYENEGL